MIKFYLSLVIICSAIHLGAQGTVTVKGIVTDEKDGSAMVGVNIAETGTTNGVTTDDKGNYIIKIPTGRTELKYTYIGYQVRQKDIIALKENTELVVNVKMTDLAKEMEIIVVSGNKIEKRLGEQTQSIEVLKGQNITQSAQTLNEAMNKVPGVNILGKTISVRGGSGFADATSNRTLALLDDVPIVSPENGSIRWQIMPIEAIDQLELVKGPATVTNGAQALNALVNIRTINPKAEEPYNKFFVNFGTYSPYQEKSYTWFWKKVPPVFGGMSYVHARKYGNVDVVFNGAYQQNQGYTAWNKNQLVRSFAKIRYIPKHLPNLSIGGSVNFAYEKYDDFFIYGGYNDTARIDQNGNPRARKLDSLVLFPTDSQIAKTYSYNVNPYVTYYDRFENRHSFKTSYYGVVNHSTTGDSSSSHKLYLEYVYTRKFKKVDVDIAAGLRYYYKKVNSITFGNKYAHYSAFYAQVEKKFEKRFTIKVGVSFEYNKLDSIAARNELTFVNTLAAKDSAHKIYSPLKPIFNVGLNYQLSQGTFLRASFGQGYRFPDIAEQFVYTPRSGAVAIPNPNLKPENSYSVEVGIKQGMKFSRWIFYADLAAYYTRYSNLIEFQTADRSTVPQYAKDRYGEYALFQQAKNVTEAQIWGIEVSAIGTGAIFGVPLNFLVGYNYMNPRNLNPNPDVKNDQYLNYRMEHSAKADIQTTYKNFIIGFTAVYLGEIKKVDQIGDISKILDWRNAHQSGEFILDARLGYNFKQMISATLIAKNMTNRAYTLRPGFLEPPVNLTLQLTYQWHQWIGKKKTES